MSLTSFLVVSESYHDVVYAALFLDNKRASTGNVTEYKYKRSTFVRITASPSSSLSVHPSLDDGPQKWRRNWTDLLL